jgi:hypothetical protein
VLAAFLGNDLTLHRSVEKFDLPAWCSHRHHALETCQPWAGFLRKLAE